MQKILDIIRGGRENNQRERERERRREIRVETFPAYRLISGRELENQLRAKSLGNCWVQEQLMAFQDQK